MSEELIKVDQKSEPAILLLLAESNQLRDYAIARVIATVEDVKAATNDLAIISIIKKTMELKRKEYLQPFQEHVKEVNDDYKLLMVPVEEADKITRSKILTFQSEQERKRREQEEINRLRLEAAQKEMELKGELTESVNLVEVIAPSPKQILTDLGSTGVMKVRKYRVVNFAELPDQYKIEHSALLNKVVKAGIPSIPGVEIYTEDSLRVTTKKA